ncbi:hypothetical protein MIND_00988400 [Mycena indigotica]|uniref:Uncharacterized protein n=1 Tax=Mycena indigotica TaxID=2126181 RepID=A0A8H6VXJ9_9AGAR|nr:uncharacterized protein MIND_00988400 [Mycena indigotica]KAF7297542.1 hypothetical protein MIND_00988400 [Mycena indigotica]
MLWLQTSPPAWLAPLLFPPFSHPAQPTPIPCITNGATFQEVIACFDAYTVPPAFYTPETYAVAQPSSDQLAAWAGAIKALLSVDGNCSSIVISPSISDLYSVSLFTDSRSSQSFCILAERYSLDGVYEKGWGIFAVPATALAVKRDLHLSAPHPQYDLYTPEQAAALFQAVSARSLLIPGRQRMSYSVPTDCVVSKGSSVYYKTDPAHDNSEPFFAGNVAIRDWQYTHSSCPSSTCAFIQLHGKSSSTCPSDTVFLSSGLGRDNSSLAWYTSSADRPVKRLKQRLISAFAHINGGNLTFSLPSDSPCALVATDNVFGRLVNGVEAASVCVQTASAENALGEFVHIEQAIGMRKQNETIYGAWAEALGEAFPDLKPADQ